MVPTRRKNKMADASSLSPLCTARWVQKPRIILRISTSCFSTIINRSNSLKKPVNISRNCSARGSSSKCMGSFCGWGGEVERVSARGDPTETSSEEKDWRRRSSNTSNRRGMKFPGAAVSSVVVVSIFDEKLR